MLDKWEIAIRCAMVLQYEKYFLGISTVEVMMVTVNMMTVIMVV